MVAMDPTTLHQALAYKLGHRRASRGWLPEQAIWLWCVDREREDIQDAITVLGEKDARHHYELGLRGGGLEEHSG